MSKGQAKLNLPDLLRMKSYRHALIATFAFSPRFFEEIALERFRAFKDNGNISVVIDRTVYEDLIARDPENRENFPKKANIRYLLYPISTPGNFHAKIFLFANEDRGLLIIGSANLTRDGLSSNAELCAVFEFDKEENTGFHRLFQDVIGYFWKLQEYAPSSEFESNLRELEREALWIQESRPEITGAPSFLHNFDRSLWDQLREAMRGQPKHLHVVSRYFDATPTLLDDVAQEFSCKEITISTQNGITTLSRPWLAHPSVKKGSTRLRLCRYSDSGQNQPLHAKAYVLETDKETLLAIGSANFTTAALRRTVSNGNGEILLLYRLPVNAIDALRFFDPDQSAVALKSAAQLITAPPQELSRTGNSFAYILDSISVDGSALIVRARLPHVALVDCVIEQVDKRPVRIPLPAQAVNPIRFTVPESIVSQLRESTAVGWLEFLEHEKKRRSNEVLIVNLQDLVTGRNIRRERQIAEARESPARFISLLNELCREGDEERLKQFLTFCDIPLDLEVRGMRHYSRSVDLTNQTHEMRDVGARNIRHFTSIYEAVLHFVERHRRRLQRHIESGTADGIPNFAHILLTVANLLVNQIERLIAGFEANSVVKLKAGEWKEIRDQLASYYEILEKLLHMTASDYVSALLRAYPRQKVRDGLVDYLKEIRETWAKALFLRDRLNELRITRVEVESGLGGVVRSPSFFKSVLADENWTQFAANLSALQREMSRRLAA